CARPCALTTLESAAAAAAVPRSVLRLSGIVSSPSSGGEGLDVAARDAEQVEDGVEPARADGAVRGLAQLGLGVAGDPEPRLLQHVEIVRAVADGDHLLERNPFARRQLLEELRLALRIDDLPDDPTGEPAVFDLERVAPGVVDPEPLPQRLGGVGEPA